MISHSIRYNERFQILRKRDMKALTLSVAHGIEVLRDKLF
jgi:hypothetical protein